MTATITATEPVSPLELNVGDYVLEAGVVLRITERRSAWTDERTGRPVVNLGTEHVFGDASWPDVDQWMKTGKWHVQGNELARVSRIDAAQGIPAHCEHSAATICLRCPAPLHCLIDADGARQFPDAGSLVSYQRARYTAQRAATLAAHIARLGR